MKKKHSRRTPPRMERKFLKMLANSQKWTEGNKHFIPTLACSQCGKGAMPLCGLGLNRKISEPESKEVKLTMQHANLRTAKLSEPLPLQLVSGTGVVIMFEQELECVEERKTPQGIKHVFTRPIPTLSGLLCKECEVCQFCSRLADEHVHVKGRRVKLCELCVEDCKCGAKRARYHECGCGR